MIVQRKTALTPFVRVTQYALLIGLAAAMLIPFMWQVATSLKPIGEVEGGSFWPQHTQFIENYTEVFKINFDRYLYNSVFTAAWVTWLQVLTSALAAYAFSRIDWPGRDKVFVLYLATLMIPGIVLMIPNFWVIQKLGMFNTYRGLIIPAAFSAGGTFLLRQFMMGLPRALDEAAEIDGASKWQIFWDVILPMTTPGLITLGIFTFLGTYQSFFWPLILVKDEHLRNLPLGLLAFQSQYSTQTNVLMAAAVITMIPMVILFMVGQRFFTSGIRLGAVKG